MAARRLERAVLLDLDSGEENGVQFNPSDYLIEKEVGWKEQDVAGRDAPAVEFTSGARRRLTTSLVFDTSDASHDVRVHTGRIEKLALVDRGLRPPRPPRLLFRWGGFEFRCVLQSCASRYLLFDSDGTPLRAELRVVLGEYHEEGAPEGGNPAAAGLEAEEEAIAGADERIDQVAERALGDPARWPEIAEASGIEDPRDLAAGDPLVVPGGRPR